MNASGNNPWPAANQRHLVAAVNVVRSLLERHAARAGGRPEDDPGHQALVARAGETAAALPAPSALALLVGHFGLSGFERDLVLLCAGIELDATFAAACATAQGTASLPWPTFGLALAVLPDAHWDALSPGRPLRRWRLVTWQGSESITQARLRLDERILHFLTGVDCLDARLIGLVAPLPPSGNLPPGQRETVRQLVAHWRNDQAARRLRLAQLCGDGADLRQVAASAAVAAGLKPCAMRAADVPAGGGDREVLARLWEREAALSGRVLLIETDPHDPPEAARQVAAFVESLEAVTLLGGREPLGSLRIPALRYDVPKAGAREQRELWQQALGTSARRLNGTLDRLILQFNLGPRAIEAAAAEALAGRVRSRSLADGLWDSSRRHARARLDDLAQRIEPAASWADLVLPPAALQQLRDIEVHVRQRTTVYDTWGFAAQSSRGLGINALFAGASGTGKTMAAEILARELHLDLYRIDLSSVVSKYIGETEKNLRRVFDAAEDSGAVLLFDEADALFGKRTEVRDSHDRYANIEVSYLLQRMEAYRGLAILTSNLKESLDDAFLRRLRFVIEFPFPDAAHREEIWRRVFPAQSPTGELDHAKLARLNLTGGNIRNVAMHAAFLAADQREGIQMKHLLQAARHEYTKLEKPLTESETRGWT